jgi:hypothetical protein
MAQAGKNAYLHQGRRHVAAGWQKSNKAIPRKAPAPRNNKLSGQQNKAGRLQAEWEGRQRDR